MSDQSVNSILSTTGGVLFAATLTDGIFRSDDGGKNWSQSNKGLIVRKVWSIEQDKHNVDNFLAGTQYGHLFSFANSGNQWGKLSVYMMHQTETTGELIGVSEPLV